MNFFNQDLSLRKIAVAVLGNLAMTFWFMPWFAKLLHKFRGVNLFCLRWKWSNCPFELAS